MISYKTKNSSKRQRPRPWIFMDFFIARDFFFSCKDLRQSFFARDFFCARNFPRKNLEHYQKSRAKTLPEIFCPPPPKKSRAIKKPMGQALQAGRAKTPTNQAWSKPLELEATKTWPLKSDTISCAEFQTISKFFVILEYRLCSMRQKCVSKTLLKDLPQKIRHFFRGREEEDFLTYKFNFHF